MITPRNRAPATAPATRPGDAREWQPVQREVITEKALVVKCPICGRLGTLRVQRTSGADNQYQHLVCEPPKGCGRRVTINRISDRIAVRDAGKPA